jgi:hypothetical protein
VKVVRLEQLSSRAQFQALPDNTLLDVGGKQVRKADLVAEFNRLVADRSAGATIRPAAGLAAIQARLTAEENAAIAASDAALRKRMAETLAKEGEQ